MAVEDTQEEREKRAERLRRQIEALKQGKNPESSEIKSPRDFIHEKMKEEEEEEENQGESEDKEVEGSPDCE
jgi:hypothetical protein